MSSIWYATREAVAAELDSKTTARMNPQIARAINSASRSIEGMMRRTFYPWSGTRYFDWPNADHSRSYRLWLDENELISLSTLTAGGVTIASTDYYLEPNTSGPPYNRIELNRSTSAAFSAGTTPQRSIAATGVFGFDLNEDSAGTTVGSMTNSQTTVTVSDGSLVGVGSLLHIESERVVVTERANITSTQTLQTPLTASAAGDQVVVTDGTQFHIGEVVTLDSERMLIVDVISNTLTVKRAWDGTVLAAHTGSTVYVSRLLTITRGQLGTTAATHVGSSSILRHVFPDGITNLCVALAANTISAGTAGWTGSAASGDGVRVLSNTALKALTEATRVAYGRDGRVFAV